MMGYISIVLDSGGMGVLYIDISLFQTNSKIRVKWKWREAMRPLFTTGIIAAIYSEHDMVAYMFSNDTVLFPVVIPISFPVSLH